ncbi:unnamed protein product [Linum trigynum]|uniref:Reverse transcriptase domain-containing protein n=1 Tax=Linum trigynum TaxID=586398 RepID=A0AAV2G1W1_9ROSI
MLASKPNIVFIVEPKISGKEADAVIAKMGFDCFEKIDAVGFSGGIWVLWKAAELLVTDVDRDPQFIHFRCLNLQDNHTVEMTAIYAKPNDHDRLPLWDSLRRIEQNMRNPWLLVGDFNSICNPSERQGGAGFNAQRTSHFNACINDCSLIDVGYTGPRFTWTNGRLLQRLDRALCNRDWIDHFPDTLNTHLPRIRSDHRPILIRSSIVNRTPNKERPFRFLAAWLSHETFQSTIEAAWKHGGDFNLSLLDLQVALQTWNKDVFGNIFKRKRSLSKMLVKWELINDHKPNPRTIQEETRVREELEQTLWQEELLWMQKSRDNWINNGDSNTPFFHTSTLARRRRNKILRLQNDDGVWVEDQDMLQNMARDFYIELFTADTATVQNLGAGFKTVDASRMSRLASTPSVEEIRGIIKNMGSLKSPGKDGFHAIFYKRCWNTIQVELRELIDSCFHNPEKIRYCNATLLTLLPKVDSPSNITQFRPIGLCNVSYKIVAKCLADRLKLLMADLVDENQTSFVPKRHITSNIIILQEIIHSMNQKKGEKGLMVLKVDLAKAYDRINWSFLKSTLEAAGFPQDFISLVMACVTTASFQVLWNGNCTEEFKPTRGLRQGCPLSPYLFTLCMERLNHNIKKCVEVGDWKQICLSKNGPQLTHLFFADDLVLLAEADVRQARTVMGCLDQFCSASGEKASKEKSRVYFSRNTKDSTKNRLSSIMGIPRTTNLGKYLGVPVIHGRITKETYKYILENIDRRLANWKTKSLSLAGRVTLATSVLNALPNYVMQTAVLPCHVCDIIDKKIRGFVWGRESGKAKTHLVTWESICKPKEEGGLGLRSARALNLAYLMKLGWQFLNNEEDLWVRVLHGKYVEHNGDGSVSFRQNSTSRLWKGMREALPLVKQHTIWDIRNGRSVRFWDDQWLAAGLALKDYITNNGHDIQRDLSVAEMVDSSGEWKWQTISNHLPDPMLCLLAGTDAPVHEAGEDTTIWSLENDGQFRLGSAYRAAVDWLQEDTEKEVDVNNQPKWMNVWKWPGPNRIRHFLWLSLHDRLLTNCERKRRKLCDSDVCEICKSEPETAEHVIRTCPMARQVWDSLGIIETSLTHGLNFAGWLATNLKREETKLLFGVAAWYLWRRRNELVFEHKFQEAGVLAHRIKAWTSTIKRAQDNNQELSTETTTTKSRQELSWQPPPTGWIVVNSDGSVQQHNSAAAAGGLLRDHLGRCVGAFVANLGSCSITRAEIVGALTGLQIAWDQGYRKVLLRLDSTAAMDFLTSKDHDSRRYHNLTRRFQELLKRNWEVHISHSYRECNKAADYLANKAHGFRLGTHCFDISDSGLNFWILYDTLGITQDRLI